MQDNEHNSNLNISNREYITISRLSHIIKEGIEGIFPYPIKVEGEVSSAKVAGPHFYFSLKEESSLINAVAFGASRLNYIPKTGDKVIVTAKLTTYGGRSQYQLQALDIEESGIGSIIMKIEALRKKLSAEGLFDISRKRALPFLPKTIGVITARESSAWQDIQSRFRLRWHNKVVLWHARVQGNDSPAALVAAIKGFNSMDREDTPDLLIISRGGGSLEDLQAFNDESVLRAVAESAIPTISAVGHEDDRPLIDDVADLRAPTPTAAVEVAVPKLEDISLRLKHQFTRLANLYQGIVRSRLLELSSAKERINKYLDVYLNQYKKHEAFSGKVLANYIRFIDNLKIKLAHVKLPDASVAIKEQSANLERLQSNMANLVVDRVSVSKNQLSNLSDRLSAYSFEGTLSRGFVIVFNDKKEPVLTADSLAKDQKLTLRFKDNKVVTVKVC